MFRKKEGKVSKQLEVQDPDINDSWEILGQDVDNSLQKNSEQNSENYICIDNLVLCSDLAEDIKLGDVKQKVLENEIVKNKPKGGSDQIEESQVVETESLRQTLDDLDELEDQDVQSQSTSYNEKIQEIENRKLGTPYEFKINKDQNLTFQFMLQDPTRFQKQDTIKANNSFDYSKPAFEVGGIDKPYGKSFQQYLQMQHAKEFNYQMQTDSAYMESSDAFRQIAPEWQIGFVTHLKKIRGYVNKDQIKKNKYWFILFGGVIVVLGIQKCLNTSTKPPPVKENNRFNMIAEKFQEKINQFPMKIN